jgi:hypothetical protein
VSAWISLPQPEDSSIACPSHPTSVRLVGGKVAYDQLCVPNADRTAMIPCTSSWPSTRGASGRTTGASY